MGTVLEKVKGAVLRRPRRITQEEYLAKMLAHGKNPDGTVKFDPTPIAPPIGYKKQPSMVEIVREMVRGERLAQAAREGGHETFEESEDFDVDDEPSQLRSEWENDFDPPLAELLKAGQEVVDERERKSKDTPPVGPQEAAGKSGGAGGGPPAPGGGTPPETS